MNDTNDHIVMALHIKFLTGPMQGASFKIKNGMTVGRSGADLNFRDGKISALHAKFTSTPDGKYFIEDLNSTNGIWLDNNRVAKSELLAGQKYRIGSIEFEIYSSLQAAQPEPLEVKPWREAVFSHLDQIQAKPRPKVLSYFKPMLTLKIIEGPQANTTWRIGYGPRDIGPVHYEFPILEPGCPDTCFTIEQSPQGPIIKTNHPDKVSLNGTNKKTEKIHDGLWIKIQNTKIEVSLDHEADS